MWVVLCSLRYMGGATGLLGWHTNSIADRALYHYYCATACNATHGIARNSVYPCVCPSDRCIVTKLNDGLWIF